VGILIKNPETERRARALAAATGLSLTGVIDTALRRLEEDTASRPKTIESIRDATDRFRREAGLDQRPARETTKADWDALWPTGVEGIDAA
jgi:hypothetical protein